MVLIVCDTMAYIILHEMQQTIQSKMQRSINQEREKKIQINREQDISKQISKRKNKNINALSHSLRNTGVSPSLPLYNWYLLLFLQLLLLRLREVLLIALVFCLLHQNRLLLEGEALQFCENVITLFNRASETQEGKSTSASPCDVHWLNISVLESILELTHSARKQIHIKCNVGNVGTHKTKLLSKLVCNINIYI